jgi:hypothetical protein
MDNSIDKMTEDLRNHVQPDCCKVNKVSLLMYTKIYSLKYVLLRFLLFAFMLRSVGDKPFTVQERYNTIVTKARQYPQKYCGGGVVLPSIYWGVSWDEERVMDEECLCLWATGSLVDNRMGAAMLQTIGGVNGRYECGPQFTGKVIKNIPATLHGLKGPSHYSLARDQQGRRLMNSDLAILYDQALKSIFYNLQSRIS